MHIYPTICVLIRICDTENQKRGFTRRHFPAINLRFSGLGCDTEIRPSGEEHGTWRLY